MDVIRDCGWLYTGMIIVCGGLFFVNNLLETYFSSCMFFSALWLSVQWCYCRSWPVISHWRCWSWCWWDRSWWCTSTTLRLSGGTSLAGREMLSVEHSLFYPQSVPTGTWHCQVGQTHPLVSGWETNSGNKFNVSYLCSLLGALLKLLIANFTLIFQLYEQINWTELFYAESMILNFCSLTAMYIQFVQWSVEIQFIHSYVINQKLPI